MDENLIAISCYVAEKTRFLPLMCLPHNSEILACQQSVTDALKRRPDFCSLRVVVASLG